MTTVPSENNPLTEAKTVEEDVVEQHDEDEEEEDVSDAVAVSAKPTVLDLLRGSTPKEPQQQQQQQQPVVGADKSKGKKKSQPKIFTLLNNAREAIEGSLETMNAERRSLEKLTRFRNFIEGRVEKYMRDEVHTAYGYIVNCLNKIHPTELREKEEAFFFDRLERICSGVDADGCAIRVPSAIKTFEKFFEKNGITSASEHAADRYGRELPLVDLYLMLFASCKNTDRLKKAIGEMLTGLSELRQKVERIEAKESKVKPTSNNRLKHDQFAAEAKKQGLNWATTSLFERTQWKIDNNIDDFGKIGSDTNGKTEEWNEDDGSASGEESDSDDDDDDDDDDDAEDEDEQESGETVVTKKHVVDEAGEDDQAEEEEAKQELEMAEEIMLELWNAVFDAMLTQDDIYRTDIQRIKPATATTAKIMVQGKGVKRKFESTAAETQKKPASPEKVEAEQEALEVPKDH
jgi:hypothetical protein